MSDYRDAQRTVEEIINGENEYSELEINDGNVESANVERVEKDRFLVNIIVPKSNVSSDYNAGDDPNRDGEPSTLHDVLGHDGVHSELVHIFAPVFDTSKKSMGTFLMDNAEITFSKGDSLTFSFFLDK